MQKPSQTLIPPCRASCFSRQETLKGQVGEPQGRIGFSASSASTFSITCA
ncbi:MAG: hypothetical protein V7K21_03215 [Nostoc sp.]